MNHQPGEHPMFGEVISVYTRAQVLADRVLIEVGLMAQEAGFPQPVAIIAAAREDCLAWTQSDSERQTHQDQSGRVWDVLFMAVHAARTKANSNRQLIFELHRVPRDGRSSIPVLTRSKLVVGPGDNAEPVMAILLPQED